MNRTYETICKLINTAMFDCNNSYEKDVDWQDVFNEMKSHGIASLIGDIIKDIPMDNAMREKWENYIILQQIFLNDAIRVQDDVCRILDETPYVIVKGMAAAINYPNPKLRAVGDIDLIINAKDSEIVSELLEENNYSILSKNTIRHNTFSKGNILIDVHSKYARLLLYRGKNAIEEKILKGIDCGRKVCYENHRWQMLQDMENGLSLISHIYQHLYLGVGFRQIIDWMLFVNSSKDICWDEFNKATKEDGVYKLQCAITKMCSIYFGLVNNNIMWMNEVDDSVCEELFDYVSSCGNFGRKISKADFRKQFAYDNKILGAIKRLQLGGMNRWKAAQKYSILRPFAWLYQGIRVMSIMLKRNKPVKSIHEDIGESRKIIKLYQDLGMQRIDIK